MFSFFSFVVDISVFKKFNITYRVIHFTFCETVFILGTLENSVREVKTNYDIEKSSFLGNRKADLYSRIKAITPDIKNIVFAF